MIESITTSLVDWSRAQFALTAMYHWIFVPLTLGLSFIMAIMELIYYKTGSEFWKKTTQFWMKLFAINFAIGVATGIILEFEFGTNWSNYSWFVGDIFGAPLAIEGIMAFFLESTFFAVMFFGWNKVSKRFHLVSTWLTAIGACLSALWILVATAGMQYPVGMEFNPDTVRNEMVDFWAVALSPVAIHKFFHTVLSSWVLAAVFVIGISSWYLLKKRNVEFAKQSIRIAASFGMFAIIVTGLTGHGTAVQVYEKQPMKLAAMEGLYKGGNGMPLMILGMLNPAEDANYTNPNPFFFKIEAPKMLSYLATFNTEAYVPGIIDIIDGGYPMPDGKIAPSTLEMMEKGRTAIDALAKYRAAKEAGNTADAEKYLTTLRDNYNYFGYGYLDKPTDIIPHVPVVFYSFHIMVYSVVLFFLVFLISLIYVHKNKIEQVRWFQWVCLLTIPIAYIASQSGWVTAEMGRQPWTIQNILPTNASVSQLASSSVKLTFFIFLVLFTVLLIAEIGIMIKAIKKGPELNDNN